MKKKLLLYSGIALILACTIFLMRYCSKPRIDINSAISMEVVDIIDSFDYSLFEVSFKNNTDYHITFGNSSTSAQQSPWETIRDSQLVQSFLRGSRRENKGSFLIRFYDGESIRPATSSSITPNVNMTLWSIPPRSSIKTYLKFCPLFVYGEKLPEAIHYPFFFLTVNNRTDSTTRHELISKPIPERLYDNMKVITRKSSISQ